MSYPASLSVPCLKVFITFTYNKSCCYLGHLEMTQSLFRTQKTTDAEAIIGVLRSIRAKDFTTSIAQVYGYTMGVP